MRLLSDMHREVQLSVRLEVDLQSVRTLHHPEPRVPIPTQHALVQREIVLQSCGSGAFNEDSLALRLFLFKLRINRLRDWLEVADCSVADSSHCLEVVDVKVQPLHADAARDQG